MNGFILLIAVFTLTAICCVIYTMMTHRGVVVALVNGGCLVKLNMSGDLVYVQSNELYPGAEVELIHPWRYQLSHLGEQVVKEFRMSAGLLSKSGKHYAFLQSKVGIAQWTAVAEGEIIFMDVDNDDRHYPDEMVCYQKCEEILIRFYEV